VNSSPVKEFIKVRDIAVAFPNLGNNNTYIGQLQFNYSLVGILFSDNRLKGKNTFEN
jgi:glutaredoxin-related protein